MKGLLLKDLINLKGQSKVLGLLLVFYIFLSVASGNSVMFGSVVAVLCAILPVTAMSYDERAKWEKYALTMPVTRADLVLSKYLLGIGLSATAFLLNFGFQLIAGVATAGESLLISLAILGVGITFLSLILPVLFRYGVEKGRLIMLLILFLPTMAIVLGSRFGFKAPGPETSQIMLFFGPVLVLLLLVASVFISLRIYSKKEF